MLCVRMRMCWFLPATVHPIKPSHTTAPHIIIPHHITPHYTTPHIIIPHHITPCHVTTPHLLFAGRLRVNISPTNLTSSSLTVTINGYTVAPTNHTNMLWAQRYRDVFEGEYLAWSVLPQILLRGGNKINFTLTHEALASGVGAVRFNLTRVTLLTLTLTLNPNPNP